MTGRTLTIIASLAFAPLSVSAQAGNANTALRQQIQALGAAGFSGMTELRAPQSPPAAMNAAPAAAQPDETTETLAALRREAKEETGLGGETARALGFDFNGELLPTKYLVSPKVQDVIRYFSVTTFRGQSDVIIQEIRKVDGRKEMRSYLIAMNGALEAAALTVKVNGKYPAEKIPVADAQAGCRELVEFWTRYYRENLKKP